ncbi:hypothetical protein A374_02819 [Fictibacillus macauensis ZFHKF-1]|uniref:Uncharacterized protein n=1 Tax=Fictibacillus macauensis ZFHKF-1 TaxID=1196324 RepID=I8J5S1_9BACL|nr:hypothetical protein [Fictibacillus macauensis]EIT87151.1 hypothetical protein A374_02819 [Fictibacillus macauensis ZFHKF-1]
MDNHDWATKLQSTPCLQPLLNRDLVQITCHNETLHVTFMNKLTHKKRLISISGKHTDLLALLNGHCRLGTLITEQRVVYEGSYRDQLKTESLLYLNHER